MFCSHFEAPIYFLSPGAREILASGNFDSKTAAACLSEFAKIIRSPLFLSVCRSLQKLYDHHSFSIGLYLQKNQECK